ncbi:hypothetical protein KKE26_08695 [bacterium]|nr:hypothetical protein [bacterium]
MSVDVAGEAMQRSLTKICKKIKKALDKTKKIVYIIVTTQAYRIQESEFRIAPE